MSHLLTAVIITHNEARNIARCLDSLRGVADETLVIDSLSEDETQVIAEGKGARFISQAWLGYSEQKNLGLALASHPYILFLDADEALSPELNQSLKSAKQSGLKGAYSFKRRNNWCGHWIRYCGWQRDINLRLWHRDMGLWEGEIHETPQLQADVERQQLKGLIYHYSYYHISEHLEKANRYTDLLAQEAYARGKRGNLAKIIFNPFFKFLKNYFLDLGFLDGFAGFQVCRVNAFVTFLKYSKLRELGP